LGSLIWCPGNLRIKTRWSSDGPTLPIEFARISSDGRLTLIVHPGSEDQATYWALSSLETLEEARRNLKEREQSKTEDIHFVCRHSSIVNPETRLQELARRADVDSSERSQSASMQDSRPQYSGVGCDRRSLIPA
jgi:hypothetical protein